MKKNNLPLSIQEMIPLIDLVNALEYSFEQLNDDALKAKTSEFQIQVRQAAQTGINELERFHLEQEKLEELLPEVFAAVREASKRTLGVRHNEIQLMGGIALHRGQIAEIGAGEGKILASTLPLYLNALAGRCVHLITMNDYLARRDSRWVTPIFHLLGLSVGVLQMAAVTENGRKAFIVDFERESPHEDQRYLRRVDRVEAYAADVIYGAYSEFGFDYLRDNMAMRLDNRVQRGHHYAIVDEVDNLLIDEARTPLIISGPVSGDIEWFDRMAQVVKQLRLEDYEVDEKNRIVRLTEAGLSRIEWMLNQSLLDSNHPEDMTPEQARLTSYLEQSLRAQFLFIRNRDYVVQGGKVLIIDGISGRLTPSRRWSDGLHQAVEAKEGVKVEPENTTYATITLQNYFRKYNKLAGMTATALTDEEEFQEIYALEVTPIPTILEYQSHRTNATLVEQKAKDEEGYQYFYYTTKDEDSDGKIFYRRKDYPDVIFRTAEAKLRAIVTEIVRYHTLGRPMLVGTTSVESSDRLSSRLKPEPVRRLLQVTLVRRAYMKANNLEEDGRLIAELTPFNEPIEKLTLDMLRNFIKPHGMTNINPEEASNLKTLLEILNLPDESADRLKAILQGGVPHQILNGRKPTIEESQVIASVGAFGAVTVTINMVDLGMDIKVGGELAEECITAVNRALRKLDYDDPFDMTLEERCQALLKVDPSNYGIYDAEVKLFLQYFEDLERVRELGGLYVIGSERHESRRLDNRLRSCTGRHGEPGSSRFFISLEDPLMQLFGGASVSQLMERLRVDDTLPLEARLVSNIIENSQTRVEGANFDVRKLLAEYDDVINSVRDYVYSMRDHYFITEDLSNEIAQLVENEVAKRVEIGLADEEGLWKLIAWLDQVQPVFESQDGLFPSYGFKLILNEIDYDVKHSIVNIISRAIQAEGDHNLRAIEDLIDKTRETFEVETNERVNAIDAFFKGLRNREETLHPQKIVEEIAGLVHLPLQLNNEMMRALGEDPESMKEDIQGLVVQQLTTLNSTRLIGAVQNRLDEQLTWPNPLPYEWSDLADVILQAAHEISTRKCERLNAQIEHDIDIFLQRESVDTDSAKLRLLLTLSQGARSSFDKTTHKQVKQSFTRFSYVFLTAQLMDSLETQDVVEDIMGHLETAEETLRTTWGQSEYSRLSQNAERLADFGPAARIAFGEERLNEPMTNLSESGRVLLIEAIGRYVINGVHRQLLLSATSELWVDFLTKIETLRISIGMEAYAGHAPITQFKSRISDMLTTFSNDVGGLVVSRAFATRPRRVEIAPIETAESDRLISRHALDMQIKTKSTDPMSKRRHRNH